MKLLGLAVALTLVSPVWPSSEVLEFRDVEHGTPHQKCHGQSCQIASLSGSSGKPYKAKKAPKDMTLNGDCCVLRHNPSARKRLYKQTPGLKARCESKQSLFERDVDHWIEEEDDEIEERANCAPKTLIFAKGTSETGPLGNSVGPALKSGLQQAEPGQWAFRGVIWHNDEFGDHCLGLTGGDHAVRLIEKVARQCPNTKIVMSGYSQGAMVTRNGIAYSKKSAHKHLKGIVTFGDPFNGAPIRKMRGPIIVFCHKGDRVCDGRNIIKPPHLDYVGTATDKAIQRIIKLTG